MAGPPARGSTVTVAADSRVDVAVEGLDVAAYEVPTDEPESDGTLEWDSTTIVVVEARAGGETGLGYTYAPAAAGKLLEEQLAEVVRGADALAPAATWERLGRALRNAGRPGVGMCAVSAVDTALWDLKARLLGGALVDPLPPARAAIWDDAELYVDANGAFTSAKDALGWAERYRREWGVSWFEEPVSSADFAGLRLLRERGPAGVDVAAGEYAYVLADFRNLLGAVDCLQTDVTRCCGITGLVRAAALASAYGLDVSAHCAPAISAHAFC